MKKRINPATGRPFVIGIPGYKFNESSFGAGPSHLMFLEKFGNPRIIMPWEDFADTGVDMLYLPGGLDTAPLNYGQTPTYRTSNQDVFKEFFAQNKLQQYIDNGVPIFGVCLGAQMLAVHFGCELTQDLMWHAQSKDRWATAHEVFVCNEAGERTSKGKGMEVNSHHHQALTTDKMSERIRPLFVAYNEDSSLTGDGNIVEAFKVKNKNIYGLQWHPEELFDGFSVRIMNEMLESLEIAKTAVVAELED